MEVVYKYLYKIKLGKELTVRPTVESVPTEKSKEDV